MPTYQEILDNNFNNRNTRPKSIMITASSIVITNATSADQYLLCDFNKKGVALPLYRFTYSSPEMDLLLPYTEFSVTNATLVSDVSAYGAGVAITYHDPAISAQNTFAIPIFRTAASKLTPTIRIEKPLVVAGLSPAPDRYLVAAINNEQWAIPLHTYQSVYPFTSAAVMSAINVSTTFYTNPTQWDAPRSAGSTNLNSKIKTYADAIKRIKLQLGYPFVNLEVCDDSQICDFIDLSMEWYTKYAGYTEEYLIFSSTLYKEPGLQIDKLFSATPSLRMSLANGLSGGLDYDLGDYRKVIGVFAFEPGESTGINTLFTLEQAMAQQTYFSYMLGNAGFDLVTWEVLKGWLDTREKVLAQKHYVDFNEHTQTLRLIPPPNNNSGYYGIVGCWVEKPIAHLIAEQWVQKYALALTKIAIGNVRGKYQAMQMFGGGTLNYNDLLAQGLKEKDELEKGLQEGSWYETAPPRFFIG